MANIKLLKNNTTSDIPIPEAGETIRLSKRDVVGARGVVKGAITEG